MSNIRLLSDVLFSGTGNQKSKPGIYGEEKLFKFKQFTTWTIHQPCYNQMENIFMLFNIIA